MAVMWCINAFGARRRLRQLQVRRRIRFPVFAHSPASVSIEIEPRGKARAFGLRVEDCGAAHKWSRFVPSLRRNAVAGFHHEVTVLKRGWYNWGPVSVSSGFPFGLVEGYLQAGS